MLIKKEMDIKKVTFIVLLFGILFSCKPDKKSSKSKQDEQAEVTTSEVYVCPNECENGMNYYMEGKCDICHRNLVKQE